MWWSHHDEETSLGILRGVGFAVGFAEERTVDGETWLWVLARKRV